MPRLIDADAMRADWLEYGQNEYVYDTNAVLSSIDEQPTIDAEPVRHGRWVKAHGMLPPEFHGKHGCSLCGHFALSWKIGHEELSNYCPNCGAKMDAKE